MFDTINVRQGPERVDVHEHRAPTDASVKLLAEMEQKARDRIEASLDLAGNGFEGTVLIERSLEQPRDIIVAVYKINGKRMRTEHRSEPYGERLEAIKALMQKVGSDIAAQVLTPAVIAALGKSGMKL